MNSEVDMKDVELNEMDPEKQPMTGDGQALSGEKNGSVKVNIPQEEAAFTGLSKEELMKVAGTPGWVRIRWVLLILFWLGWAGMLAGAIAIIVQAPRCKPIPDMKWWNHGPLYQIADAEAFSDGLAGMETKLDNVNQLKVKGLVLGPLHTVQADQPSTLDLKQIDPTQGSEKDLIAVLEKAHKKGISVVLDLTPNYRGASPWFSRGNLDDVMDSVQAAAEHWLNLGVDGIKISDLATASNAADLSRLLAAVKGNDTEEDAKDKKMLMGVAQGVSAAELSQLLNTSGADLVLSDLLSAKGQGAERINALNVLHSEQGSLAWGLGSAQRDQMSKRAASRALIRLYQLLLFTMPGTPVFSYGDEIGLQMQGDATPKMVWDLEKDPEADGGAVNDTTKAEREEYVAVRKWFKSLSDLRGKERSLLHGDYYPLQSSASSLAFLRLWDQSERYVTAVNWGEAEETLQLTLAPTEGVELPNTAMVKLSTDPVMEVDSTVDLDKITLGPAQGVLLQFPYTG